MSFYAVHIGRQAGVFTTWNEAAKQVNGFSGAVHRKCTTLEAAKHFVEHGPSVTPAHVPTKRPRQPAPKQVTSTLPGVYCDGSCINNGTDFAKAGYGVFVSHDSPYNISQPVPSDHRHTNQVAELLAAIHAVRVCQLAYPNCDNVIIYTDSKYVVKYVIEWRQSYIADGWSRHLVNKDLMKQLNDELANVPPTMTIHFKWVKGHARTEGNIRADRLANQGVYL